MLSPCTEPRSKGTASRAVASDTLSTTHGYFARVQNKPVTRLRVPSPGARETIPLSGAQLLRRDSEQPLEVPGEMALIGKTYCARHFGQGLLAGSS